MPTPSGSRRKSPPTRSLLLLLADQLQPAAHILRGSTVLPADTLYLDPVIADEGKGRFLHVLVFRGVEVGAAF